MLPTIRHIFPAALVTLFSAIRKFETNSFLVSESDEQKLFLVGQQIL